jgi:uncharacterized protein involved in high-affinity Fe2+ transport
MNQRWLGPIAAVLVLIAIAAILAMNLQTEPPNVDSATQAAPGATPPSTTSPGAHSAADHVMPMGTKTMMAMVAKDGPHYGATVRMPGHGKYWLTYTIYPPDPVQFGRHTDPITGVAAWWEPFKVEFEFDYQGVKADGADQPAVAGVPFREFPIGKTESHNMEVQAVWLPPVQMEGMDLPQDPDVIHLEADIHALEGHPNGFSLGDWNPYLRVEYDLTPVD